MWTSLQQIMFSCLYIMDSHFGGIVWKRRAQKNDEFLQILDMGPIPTCKHGMSFWEHLRPIIYNRIIHQTFFIDGQWLMAQGSNL